jgi:hypothetical protein
VVDSFVGEEANLIEGFGYKLLLAPVDVPVIFFGLRVLASEHGLLDAVLEEGLELDVAAAWGEGY